MVAGPNRSEMVDDGQSRCKAMEDDGDDAGALAGTPENREAGTQSSTVQTVLDRPLPPLNFPSPPNVITYGT